MLISHGQENNEEAPNSLTRLMTTPVYHQLFPGSRKIWKALEVFLTRQDLLHLSICFHTIQSLQAWHSMAFHGIFHGISMALIHHLKCQIPDLRLQPTTVLSSCANSSEALAPSQSKSAPGISEPQRCGWCGRQCIYIYILELVDTYILIMYTYIIFSIYI